LSGKKEKRTRIDDLFIKNRLPAWILLYIIEMAWLMSMETKLSDRELNYPDAKKQIGYFFPHIARFLKQIDYILEA
jgi:hypothetical protein